MDRIISQVVDFATPAELLHCLRLRSGMSADECYLYRAMFGHLPREAGLRERLEAERRIVSGRCDRKGAA